MNQYNLLNEYIQRCDDTIKTQDFQQAQALFLEIMSVYEFEIHNFWNGLQSDIGRARINWEYTNPHWLVDLPIIKAKLINYAATLKQANVSSQPLFINNNNITTNASANVDIDFQTNIKIAQYKISEMDSLSTEDTKIALQKLDELLSIAKSKDTRKTKWQKIGSIFKWIADKSVDLAVAFAPTLMNIVCSL